MQFERLCSLLLEAGAGLSDVRWRGSSDTGRVALVDHDVALPDLGIRLRGPLTVAVVWARLQGEPERRLSEFADRIEALSYRQGLGLDDRLLVLTNLDGDESRRALGRLALAEGERLVVLGTRGIAACLDRDPALRAGMPSVLGLRDLEPLIDASARARSSFDIERAQELARVFWPTRAYERARAVLAGHRFVVLTGPPEMGKTAIAQMLVLAQLTDGWEAHECTDPEQVWRVFERGRRQVFVADDAFGSTEYRPDAAERWARALGRLLTMLDSRHWLIWTSRPAPLKEGLRRVQRERGSERFPSPGEVLVDASDLDLAEKTLILFRHAKASGPSEAARRLLRLAAVLIVEHPHFTPERIRRFVSRWPEELPRFAVPDQMHLLRLVEQELASPTEAMRTSFRALAGEHRGLLISLLDAPAGLIDERDLAATVRRHLGGLSRSPGDLIDRLTDHFLRITPLGIGWVHPSWRDLVLDELRADPTARQRFLAACGVDGVMLALSQAGGAAGERTLPLLVGDADWDQLGDRLGQLLRELEDQDLARVLLAISNALSATRDTAQAHEAQSLAVYLLDATRRARDQARRPWPVFLLEAWYELSTCVPERADPPRLALTWAELHPGTALLENPDRSELARADEWLAVAEMLARYDPAALVSLGFFERDRDLLEGLIVALARPSADEDLQTLSESVLARIERLVPELAKGAHGAIEIGRLLGRLGRKRWWVPEDILAPPSTEPVTAGPTAFGREDVHRVLSDL